jgi:DNA-binding NarL/FixJ family response regulator
MSRILLIDENPLQRFGLSELLKRLRPACAIIEVETVTHARELLREHADIALIMLDIRVPDCGGFGGVFRLEAEFPGIPVVVMSANIGTAVENRAAAFGVAGFISKSAPLDAIAQTLRRALPLRLKRPLPLSQAPTG